MTFIKCSQALLTMQLYGPKYSTTENKTCWVIGPTYTGSVISPRVMVVAPSKLERFRPAKFNISAESFIWLQNEQLQQICGAARIYQHPMYIKTVNTKGEYKCITMEHNDPI